ncbi:4-(cytidine 5'-diphospho)-2-C-methyl-D-erythritol kinase [Culicoidibacter larvae]|uniref:4-diphosphocytidyl-2-C-methyl-D-erythritol kinase n=1 Tax=Culicoidibacter larvae TaxID=2579976 RepID=A0A5R8QDJ9_9FIRM|nr:4-(cytidine 5'-diphospho)-2-C-methyl-D-erythritol kinase [Culicoidibacter larvae]TLG73837.1 4-(cytidine 5'-diphospho)-2-C-methyl-D-erythritol kinase [Culicoidibacter larvae]
MGEVIEKAYAKINLTLDVLFKRDDGYHEVEMIMTSLELADYLSFSKRDDKQILLSAEGGSIPVNEENLCYKAAFLLQQHFGVEYGVNIAINKQIPVAAGLAGGSSDAAATLRGLNTLWELKLSLGELEELGAQIGSDVPFCVRGNTALARGRGEVLELIAPMPSCFVVLAKPKFGFSTARVYDILNLNNIVHPDTTAMIAAIESQDVTQIGALLSNVLANYNKDEIVKIKQVMDASTTQGVLMSGSGPTMYALFSSENQATRLFNSLKGFCDDVYLTKTRMSGKEKSEVSS